MRVGTARCIVKDDDKILLCYYKKDGYYFLPGGGIEYQELAEDTVYREFEEELGIKRDQMEITRFVGAVENIFQKNHYLEIIFEGVLKNKNIKSLESENIDFYWKKISDIDDLDIRPKPIKNVLKSGGMFHVTSVDK